MNILERLNSLVDKQWSELFKQAEKQVKNEINLRDSQLKYRYLGEIDDPEEMLYKFASVSDVQHAGGKTNWFICSDGSYYTCGDYGVDCLIESNACVDETFEVERVLKDLYYGLKQEDKVQFRMQLQGIPEQLAHEIVCYDLGIQAYKYEYSFLIKETSFNDYDKKTEVRKYTINIEADSDEDANEKLNSELWVAVGGIISEGTMYTKEDNIKMRETGKFINYKGGTHYTVVLKSRDIELLQRQELTD